MLVEWLPQALEALEEIAGYLAERNPYAAEQMQATLGCLAERNPYAAEQMQATLEATVEALPLHPYIHRPGRVPGTREAVVHPNYLVVYRVGTERISILDVLHARQEYP
ncbi:addiction module antitoxin [Pseudomonas syringae]|uniref:type II toxin-antitoxin system RelE/ParE family toxin n=1 Tax=Pseudomonas syringae TaxID=317 RepID=UPI001012CD0E|nr:type II toxin-antitoxin system RelE/ParE family toxin [Pseudomonas syringae]MBI6560855.1 type II toxin-antitoxin system RelE/ParE family toxin [Pseudomonas syringae]MBI6572280.1 type II toxin-antitoxin system RelE/ParE family toxin [Pseudomonas syringae]MBI6587877.1 type II toxin-antitoxin system RelE/ParE family toxin [Pseudomonas syringae]MBI6595261.1 type II toxin-antitoxin system RelE/ParE family toxin [Pseudomonas syringae]MDC6494028.1 type II toxin-antitoxin system RelE/ParE family to